MNDRSDTILQVEDDADDVLLLRRAFQKAGVAPPLQVVRDGEAAVAYLAGQNEYADRQRYPLPSLVLLDLKLPLKPGLDVLSWIRRNPSLKYVPVVILTSSQEPSDLRGAYDRGANSYLVKPVGTDLFTRMARTLAEYWISLNREAEAVS